MRRAGAVRRAIALAAVALLATSCGGEDARGGGQPRLVVAAAASLSDPLRTCSRDFAGADVRLSFAGSDQLAAQVRRGVRFDVLAAADTVLPRRLAAAGLLRAPVAFATNELVVAVPAGSDIRFIDDLARDGVAVAVGAPAVPVGAYTRELLGRLDPATEAAILANVRSAEPDVRGVAGKVAQGGADAGFVYATDVAALEGRLDALVLPDRLQPDVAYAAGVVDGAANPSAARRYLEGLRSGACADALREAGFGPPPAR